MRKKEFAQLLTISRKVSAEAIVNSKTKRNFWRIPCLVGINFMRVSLYAVYVRFEEIVAAMCTLWHT